MKNNKKQDKIIETNPDEQYKKLKEIADVNKRKIKRKNNENTQKEKKTRKINYEKQNIENINLGKEILKLQNIYNNI